MVMIRRLRRQINWGMILGAVIPTRRRKLTPLSALEALEEFTDVFILAGVKRN
jgi:hypothetical protein